MKSVLLVSHGSRNKKCLDEIKVTTEKIKSAIQLDIIEYAFLEIEHPLIPEGIEKCIKQGAEEVLVLLNFLNAGRHTESDIPEIVADVRKKYPNIKVKISTPVGQQDGMIDLFCKLVHEN